MGVFFLCYLPRNSFPTSLQSLANGGLEFGESLVVHEHIEYQEIPAFGGKGLVDDQLLLVELRYQF